MVDTAVVSRKREAGRAGGFFQTACHSVSLLSGRAGAVTCCLSPQVLDVIAPPYTSDFVQLFLPILENDSIAGTIKTEGEHDPVTEFVGRVDVTVPLLQF